MVELPPPRKIGAPEFLIVLAVIAMAAPLTVWWHGLYEVQMLPNPGLDHLRIYPEALPESAALPTEPYTVVGFLARPTIDGGTYVFPGSKPAVLRFRIGTPPLSDPNQTLLLGVGIVAVIGAILYGMAVYPTLRR